MTSQQEDITVQTGEATLIPAPLVNPPERASTTLSYKVFRQLCTQFGIVEADAILPEKSSTADVAPPGFVSVNRQMCLNGAIPPFNDFLQNLLRRLAISPFQLHPNGYAILMGLCVLFRRTLDRFPSFDEICYLCSFARNKDHPSITVVRSARNRKLITGLSDSVHGFLSLFFFVRCPLGFYAVWREGSKIIHLYFFYSLSFPKSEMSSANFIFTFQRFLPLPGNPATSQLSKGLWLCQLRREALNFC